MEKKTKIRRQGCRFKESIYLVIPVSDEAVNVKVTPQFWQLDNLTNQFVNQTSNLNPSQSVMTFSTIVCNLQQHSFFELKDNPSTKCGQSHLEPQYLQNL
jgi:hypothetical protein